MQWIIHWDRGTLVTEDVNRGIWELSVLCSQFFCKPKTPPNIKSLLRDGMGREEGGGFRMGNTCIPVADSF